MSLVLRGGRIIDSGGERVLDVEIAEAVRTPAVGTGLNAHVYPAPTRRALSPPLILLPAPPHCPLVFFLQTKTPENESKEIIFYRE